MRERKSAKSNSEQQQLQQHTDGHLSKFEFAKLLDPDASWDKVLFSPSLCFCVVIHSLSYDQMKVAVFEI